MEIINIYIIFVSRNLKNYNTMTRFESNVYDAVESVFGTEAAEKNFRFCRSVVGTLAFMGYCLTLPFEFVRLVWINLKERGVI